MQRIDIQKIKDHVERNKKRYILGAAVVGTLVVAAITRSIMRRRIIESYARGVSDAVARGATDSYSKGLKNGLALRTVPGTSFAEPVSQTHGNASPITFARGNVKQNITTNVYKGTKGHPGYVTRCTETGDIFSSQKKAANAFGISEQVLSNQLRGEIPNAKGLHFERVVVQ